MTNQLLHAIDRISNDVQSYGRCRNRVSIALECGRVVISRGISSETVSNLKNRKEIAKFTKSSRNRLAKYARCSNSNYRALATLTYPSGFTVSGRDAQAHLKALWKRYNRLKVRSGGVHGERASWLWFREFQVNGQLHFHFFTNFFIPKAWLSKAWYDIVNSGNPDHLKSGTNIKRVNHGKAGIASYCLKYAKKEEQKTPPKGFKDLGRFWGVFGERSMSAATVSYTLDDCGYKDYVKGVITRLDAIFASKCRGNLPVYEVKPWNIPCGQGDVVGETWLIKHPKLEAKMRKLIEEVKADAENYRIPPKPYEKTVFHAMRSSPSSVELLRRYGKLQERDYRVRCKTARIADCCDTDQRPPGTTRRTEETRRDKKFQWETRKRALYDKRMGHEPLGVL
jgi:hypothetical protein